MTPKRISTFYRPITNALVTLGPTLTDLYDTCVIATTYYANHVTAAILCIAITDFDMYIDETDHFHTIPYGYYSNEAPSQVSETVPYK